MLCIALHQYYIRRDSSSAQSGKSDDSSNSSNSLDVEELPQIELSSAPTMPKVLENTLNAGKNAARKAKIRAELLILDRRMNGRKKAFGIELYDELSNMTCSQDFYSTNHELISAVRPHLLTADREIRALSNKQLQAKGDLEIAVARRAEAFPVKATNWKEKASNAATATGMISNETKFKTRMALVNSQMNAIKEKFGLQIFVILDETFSKTGTGQLPVHCAIDKDINTIRFVFQKCRTDLDDIERTKKQKLELIDSMNVDMSLRRL